jgi:hypothetical protein
VSAPPAPSLSLTPQGVKTFGFTWTDVAGESEYRLLEDPDGVSGYTAVATLAADTSGFDLIVPLAERLNARYILQACQGGSCADSAPVFVSGTLAEAVGYVKASNTGGDDQFGYSVALSADGTTLAVGAPREGSNATGIGGSQGDDAATADSGAVYLFTRDAGGIWTQQAYVKASNSDGGDEFGHAVALSADGATLAVGARREAGSDSGIDGAQNDDLSPSAGAVYVFTRDGAGTWAQQAYVKASNTSPDDQYGFSLALSADGDTLAVGSRLEGSNSRVIDGNQNNGSAFGAGAVYVFTRDSMGTWSQQAYVKASNTGSSDQFGFAVALSANGDTLAVGANGESSSATGIGRDQENDSAASAGAVYVYTRDALGHWSQQAYVKASNTDAGDVFGTSVALAADGATLAVGAPGEASNTIGVGGDQTDDSADDAGAVYVFTRNGAGTWSQQAYVKASNTGAADWFGWAVDLSADGATLAVGARQEASDATGIGGSQGDDPATLNFGAAYLFTRDAGGVWTQQAYVKAPNADGGDEFGTAIVLAADGAALAVGARFEASNATGIGGDQANEMASGAGAVYLY